jgi:hypothetical protein
MDDFDPSFFRVSFDNALASVALEMVSSVHFAKIAVATDVLVNWVLADTRAADSNQHERSFRWISGNRLLSTDLSEATGKLFALPAVLFFARRKPLQPLHSVVGQTQNG